MAVCPKMNGNKEEFTAWCKKLCKPGVEKSDNAQFLELYHYLLHCFTEADTNKDGEIDIGEFDAMVVRTAWQSIYLGFAPNPDELFKTPEERLASRTKTFQAMDENHDGTISFNEFLKWCFDHIIEKTKELK